MLPSLRPTLLICLLAAAISWSAEARAWVELAVRADNVTIDLDRSGGAIVAHEILLRLRGGPLDTLTFEGVDADAEPLPDATITRMHRGGAAGMPIPLSLRNEDGRLAAAVQLKKGIRGGTYLVQLRYRANFAERERLTGQGGSVLLRWKSPVFDSGIDSMRVLLRVPHADEAPRLPGSDADEGLVEEVEGVFLATARGSGDVDELEIVRPHVAKREEVTWRALLDAGALDLQLADALPMPDTLEAAPTLVPRRPTPRDPRPWTAGGLAAVVFGLLVGFKGVASAHLCRRRGATPRGALATRPVLRGALAGCLLGAAVVVGWVSDYPTAAGALLAAAMIVATSLPPRARQALRGPGAWERVSSEVAFADARRSVPLGARLFDAGHVFGFGLFASLLLGFAVASALVLRSSAYHGVMLALATGCLFPLFCTGRASDLPPEPLQAARERLFPLFARLSARGLQITAHLRRPSAGGAPDEVRLHVTPKHPLKGVVAIEVGVDEHRSVGGTLSLPFVIARLQEPSPAFDAMPAGLLWTRGRDPDERVAVLRPKLPTRRLTMALVGDVVATLTSHDVAPSQSRSRVSRSSGKAASTAKPAVPAAPAHAT